MSLPTLEIVSRANAALPMKGQAMAPCASNYVTGHKKGCGFWAVSYLEVKIVLRGSIGSKQSSVIVNWEVVRSSEVRDALNLWQIQSVP